MTACWKVSINELVSIFRMAILGVIPAADKAKIQWRNPVNYDDWDRIATALYKSFVADTIENARECASWPSLAEYDMHFKSYDKNASILVTIMNGELLPFIVFETTQNAFDTCVFAMLISEGVVTGLVRKPFSGIDLKLTHLDQDATVLDALTVQL
jgi:hypothetical protein